MKKVLFLSYFYPPQGGAGVQRVAKLIKYLPEFGYEPVVAAGTGLPGKSIRDETLLKDVRYARVYPIELTPREQKLLRLAGHKIVHKIPGTGMAGWLAGARRALAAAIEAERPDVLAISLSPFPAVKAALWAAEKYKLPLVLDLRDPWVLDPVMIYTTWLHYRLDLGAMHRACKRADAVVMNTPASLGRLREVFPDVPREKSFSITNGWDEEDILPPENNARPRDPSLTIVHTGTFLTKHAIELDPSSRRELGLKVRMMDRVRYPRGAHVLARTPYYLFKSLRRLLDEGKLGKNDVRMICAGADTPEDRELVRRFGLEAIVEFRGYLDHPDSLALVRQADVLFVHLHLRQGGGDPLIVPGKVYEYLASRKPILALVPEGDAREYLARSGLGRICHPTDVEGIGRTVLQLLAEHRHSGIQAHPDREFIGQFSRRQIARRFAGVLDYARGERTSLAESDSQALLESRV